MHVALTRATVGCVVVGSEAELRADPRLMPAAASSGVRLLELAAKRA